MKLILAILTGLVLMSGLDGANWPTRKGRAR